MKKIQIWNDFINSHKIIETGVPLFFSENLSVSTLSYGTKGKIVLKVSLRHVSVTKISKYA